MHLLTRMQVVSSTDALCASAGRPSGGSRERHGHWKSTHWRTLTLPWRAQGGCLVRLQKGLGHWVNLAGSRSFGGLRPLERAQSSRLLQAGGPWKLGHFLLAYACKDWGQSDRLGRAQDGHLVRSLKGHGHWVNTLALSAEFALRTGAFDHTGAAPKEPAAAKAQALQRRARPRAWRRHRPLERGISCARRYPGAALSGQ